MLPACDSVAGRLNPGASGW